MTFYWYHYLYMKKSAKSQLFSKTYTAFEELTPYLFLANIMLQRTKGFINSKTSKVTVENRVTFRDMGNNNVVKFF